MKLHRKWNRRDGWYQISPAEAIALLNDGARNRPLREARAQKIAAEIKAGTWRENGESVIFDGNGRLIDGQHRLRACVLADRPIVVFCVFGVPAKFFPSFDQGKVRGGDDLAALMDFSNATSVAAVARLAIMYADGALTKTGQPPMASERLRLFMDRNREGLTDAVEFSNKFRKGIVKLIPISHAAFLYFMNRIEPERSRAADFIERLATGIGLHKGDALLLFRTRMVDLIGEKHKLTQTQKLALLIKAWNAFLAGKQVGVLRLRDDEPFPKFGPAED